MFQKKQKFIVASSLVLGSSAFFSTPTMAQEDDLFTLKAMTGVEYNNNLTVSDVDLTSGVGDLGFLLDLGGSFSLDTQLGVTLDGGYEYSSTRYLEETQFDFETHALSGGVAYSLGELDLGLDAGFYHNRLGGDSFLDLMTITPSVSTMLGETVYLRGQYSFMDKDFKTAPDRSGNSHSFGVSGFIFALDDGYINLGLELEKSNTDGGAYDYDGYTLSGGINVPFLDTDFYAKGKYSGRSYDTALGDDGETRDDTRSSFSLGLTTDLFVLLTVNPEYRMNKVSSNQNSAAFTEHVFKLSIGVTF